MINKVILIGNLGKDPEIKKFDSGSMVGKFSVATNENYRDKSGEWQTNTEWHDVVVWGSLAERAERNLQKGNMVYIEGKLTKRKWQDKDGNDRYTTEVKAAVLRKLDRNENSGSSYVSGLPDSKDEFPPLEKTSNTVAPISESTTNQSGTTTQMPEDDLPF